MLGIRAESSPFNHADDTHKLNVHTSCPFGAANCHFKLRVFSSAKDMYMRSLECSRELGDVVSELKDTYNVALCDSRLGKWAEASNWLDKASRLAAR